LKRREFLGLAATVAVGTSCRGDLLNPYFASSTDPASYDAGSVLAGTAELSESGDFALRMVDSIHKYLMDETATLLEKRARLWTRDYSSRERYEQSVEPNRQRLCKIIGAVDTRGPIAEGWIEEYSDTSHGIAQGKGYSIYEVGWPVFPSVTADSNGMTAAGLLLQPHEPPIARVVAIPDADWTPEAIAGITNEVPAEAQFGRRLAEHGVQVLIPQIINRQDQYSGIPGVGMTNMPHREWIYRMAFEVGRHIVGFEVQEIQAAVDWFERQNTTLKVPIGVMGYGEGGLLALYAAAIDRRIASTVVSGYFQPRENLWQEPIYRDMWGLLKEFGDAEVASLIAPRTLIVEACRGPEITGPPRVTGEHKDCACPNGRLTTPAPELVESEVKRARPFFEKLNAGASLQFLTASTSSDHPGTKPTLLAFLHSLGYSKPALVPDGGRPSRPAPGPDSQRLRKQFNGLVDYTQALIRRSPAVREEFWNRADARSPQAWVASTQFYREYIWDEVIGRMPSPSLQPSPRTRLIFDEPKFKGYEVLLDVWPGIFAYGILLLPRSLKPGERRPVVVCQHGLEGRPSDVADPKLDHHFYHHFAVDLAEEGFITFAPQNPYIGEDHFRMIQRKGHPLKLALFSFILGQHEQILNWLSGQPFVDASRIGFYGLSYGGKTAVRVPPLLGRYALSICSGDFNEWVWKTTTVIDPQSYLLTQEYDMYEFNFANLVNYSDLANLMVPRPFMIERGHEDTVSLDQWVAFEYAKVQAFYSKMNLSGETQADFFNGPHTIHGVETFRFLRHHLGLQT
jgi:dienelactone hydrolase